jgi:hypothetical protein
VVDDIAGERELEATHAFVQAREQVALCERVYRAICACTA